MNYGIIFALLLLFVMSFAFVSTNRLSIRLPILLSKTPNGKRIGWLCDFSVDNCGIINQYNMGSKFRLIQSEKKTTFGKNSLYLLEIKSSRSFFGARLETPYFPANNQTDGCLGIEYLITGLGRKKMILTQQNQNHNRCLWQTINNKVNSDWKIITVNVDFRKGEPRFFIDALTDHKRPNRGSFAISKLWFSYGNCEKNDIVFC